MQNKLNILIIHDKDFDKSIYQPVLADNHQQSLFLSVDDKHANIDFEVYALIIIDFNSSVNAKLSELNSSLHNKIADTYSILISPSFDQKTQELTLDLGIDDYLIKPVSKTLLQAILKTHHTEPLQVECQTGLPTIFNEALNTHAIVSVADRKGNITYVNDNFCQISGYSKEELIGQNHRLVKSGIHNREFYQDIWSKISKGKTWAGIICNKRKNGEKYWVRSTIMPFVDPEKETKQYISIRTDVTAIIKAERFSELLNTQLNYLMDNTQSGIVFINSFKIIHRSNHAFSNYFSGSKDKLDGSNLEAYFNDKTIELLNEKITNVKQDKSSIYNVQINHANDIQEHLNFSLDVIPQFNSNKNIIGYILIFNNVTELMNYQVELASNEYRFRESQRLANIGSWEWNIETGDLHWSEQVAPIFGYKTGEIETSYENFIKAVHPDDVLLIENAIQQCIDDGQEYHVYHRCVWPDGSTRWVSEKGNVIRNSEGKAIKMLGIVQDINELKTNQILLNQYKSTLDQTHDCVFMFNAHDYKFFYFNQGALNQTGYSAAELFKMRPIDLKAEFDKGYYLNLLNSIKSGEENSTTYETIHYNKKREVIPVEISLQFIRPTSGEPRFVEIVRNISARKNYEHQISQQSYILTMQRDVTLEFMSNSDLSTSTHEMLSKIISITNSKFGLIAEINTEQVNNKHIEQHKKGFPELNIHSCIAKNAQGQITDVLISDDYQHEIGLIYQRLKRINAQIIYCPSRPSHDKNIFRDIKLLVSYSSYICTPVYTQGDLTGFYIIADSDKDYYGNIKHYTKSFTTTYSAMLQYSKLEQQKNDNQLQLLKEKDNAEKANAAKSDFLASMSHELRTPLNAIVGFSQLYCNDNSLNEDQKINADIIYKAGKHLLELINDILDLAKVESGKTELEITDVSLADLMQEAIILVEQLATEKNIEITKPTCHFHVLADYIRLKQILINLLSNAIKYNNINGFVKLSCDVLNDELLRISVIDNGFGIKNQDQSSVFEPFQRFNDKSDGEIEGTGIGLVVSKSLAESMQGDIGFTSEYQKGSHFWVDIPLKSIEINALKQTENISNQLNESNLDDSHTSSYSVEENNHSQTLNRALIIEDNEFNQALITQQLEILNIIVDTVENGRDALIKLSEQSYQIILSDLNMPVMNGYEFISEYKKDNNSFDNSVPVIAITANAMPGEKEKCLSLGFDDYLSKPVEMNPLQEIINTYLKENQNNAKNLTPSNTKQADIFDESLLNKFVGDNQQGKLNLIAIFLSNSQTMIKELVANKNLSDMQKIKDISHKFKSSSKGIGALRLYELLVTIEQKAKSGNTDNISDDIENLEKVYQESYQAIESYSKQLSSDLNNDSPDNKIIERLANHNILIIDDDEFVLEQIKTYFKKLKSNTLELCSDSKRAMQMLNQRSQEYNLIICDLNMPDIDGISFIRALNEQNYTGWLIIISGEDSKVINSVESLATSYHLNLLGSLKKPFSFDELVKLISVDLEVKQQTKPQKSNANNEQFSEQTIREGLEQDCLTAFFQPKVNLQTMKIESFEALARWRKEDGSIIPPFFFIPVAEKSDLINDITDIIFEKSVTQLADWNAKGHDLSIAVNFSMSSMARIELPKELHNYCTNAGVSPEKVVIEVTESGIVKEHQVVLEVLSRLRIMGFQLSIDDYGTGYSTIDQLQKLPFNELKLDRSYVGQAANNQDSYVILESSIDLAKKLNMKIIAEGVETKKDLQIVKQLGANYAQGYLIAKPLPEEQVIDSLNNNFQHLFEDVSNG